MDRCGQLGKRTAAKDPEVGEIFLRVKIVLAKSALNFSQQTSTSSSIPGALESNTKVSLVRISSCHFQLCSPGNARTTSINRTFFQRVGSCNNSYLGSGFAAQSSGLPFRKHNVTRFSGGCANMARWFHISLEETLGAWDGLRLLISPERKPFLMTCVRCRRIASCW